MTWCLNTKKCGPPTLSFKMIPRAMGLWEGLARTQVRKGEEEKEATADRRTRKEAGDGEWRTLRATRTTRSHTDH